MLATKDEKIIGTANMKSFLRKRISHRGTFGISVLKEFSGQGIGSMLLAEIINYAKSINLEILELERIIYLQFIYIKNLDLKNMDYMKIFLKFTINIMMGHLCY
ncbi:GNAT family N-acetyltransferase [Pediococcus acidilactici]|uniref:GNAT family N-acetyltransferase n=1 Tax=Pediococcus acidilactici TaxID=1254 RepID=UPI00232F4AF2|nr:GNAT family N-acetyltransferase [Pediococcus acidilactici]MDB8868987.1 GNAT family N-acetyltransferase [Pediococcus acidilactici]